MRAFKELVLIMKGMADSLSTIMWVALLLLMIIYISGIFFAQQIGSPEAPYAEYDTNTEWEFNNYLYFGTLPRAMFTLFNLALLTEDWDNVGRAVLEKQPWLLIFLLIFLCFNTFGLMNVIVGVIVDNTLAAAESVHNDREKVEMQERLATLDKVHQFVLELDRSHDLGISIKELSEMWNRPEMVTILKLIRLPVGSTADELLALLDADGDGQLDAQEFVRNTVRMLTSDSHQHFLTSQISLHQILFLVRELAALTNSIRQGQLSAIEKETNEDVAASVAAGKVTEVAQNQFGPSSAKLLDAHDTSGRVPPIVQGRPSEKKASNKIAKGFSTREDLAGIKGDVQQGFRLMWEEVRKVSKSVEALGSRMEAHFDGKLPQNATGVSKFSNAGNAMRAHQPSGDDEEVTA